MCRFFSLISDGKGKPLYFDKDIRRKILKGKLNLELDSHTSIAHHFKVNEDRYNKYEFNPLLRQFQIDQLNTENDSKEIKKFCLALDFKEIVPELILKPIIHPFRDRRVDKITPKDIALLEKWASVWASVGDSVWASVWASVGDSVGDSVRDSVWTSVGASVWASVWDSVWDSVGASVWDSVWASVRASVWDSVWAYSSSFFDIKYKYDFSPLIKLWEKGLVPSFDGKIWRLHGGEKSKILYKLKTKES